VKKYLKNNKGVAILMVLACILFLSTVVIDFFADSLRNHQISLNYKSRIQGYYLAKSGVNFSKLLLYYNKEVESILEKKGLSYSELGFEPLYKMFPINSEMIRGLIASSSAQSSEDEAGDDDSEGSELDDAQEGISMLKKDEVEAFLDFSGNFDASISEEYAKYSLNAITKMTTTSSNYDLYKKILMTILRREEYKTFFENQEDDTEKLIHAMADFVDANDSINEFDKVERGREDSIYDDIKYKIKNAAFLTLSELRLVHGMSDDIYESLKDIVTVYHTSDKINVCLADERIVDALIVHYTNYAECTTPIKEDDVERIEELRDIMLSSCPDITAVATALNVELGLKSESETEEEASTAETKSTSSQVSGCAVQFEKLITDTNDIFRIQGTGSVNGVNTVITVVLNASSSKTSSWKVLYYQVQ
jgi:type II secretory pathway component PulK